MIRACFLRPFALTAIFSGAISFAAEAIVELPAYTVTESRELPPPERWSYARIEGFEVLSNASERETRDLLEYLRRFSRALDVVWPGVRRTTGRPSALVICGRGGKFDQFTITETSAHVDRGKNSLMLRNRDQSAIVVDYQAKAIDLLVEDEATRSVTTKTFDIDAHQQLTREYIRFLFDETRVAFPAWFVEGVAQILMTMEVSSQLITVGRVEDADLVAPDGKEWDRGFAGTLWERGLLPMPELLAVKRDSETARNVIRSTWAKQSAAFVHWGIYGNSGRNQKAFLQFVARVVSEPLSEELFKECFKLSYSQMVDELRSYVDFTPYRLREFRAKQGEKLPELPPLELREATEGEVGRIKGDALRLAGNERAAFATMIAAYLRGDRDPLFLGALGLLESARGETARAKKFLQVAVDGGVVHPRVYFELARLRFDEVNSAVPGGGWTAVQVRPIESLLLTARTQGTTTSLVHELLGLTWLRSDAPPELEHLRIADEGVRRFPRNANLIYAAAVLMHRAGRAAECAVIIKHGLNVLPAGETRAKLVELQATLPAR